MDRVRTRGPAQAARFPQPKHDLPALEAVNHLHGKIAAVRSAGGSMAAALEWLFRSRLRVVLIVVGVLVLLDVGRSLYARLAYAEATERWQPDPSVYADIKWPPGADLPA